MNSGPLRHRCVYYCPQICWVLLAMGQPVMPGSMEAAPACHLWASLIMGFASHGGWCSLPPPRSHPNARALPSRCRSTPWGWCSSRCRCAQGWEASALQCSFVTNSLEAAALPTAKQHLCCSSLRSVLYQCCAGADWEVSSPVPAAPGCTRGPRLRKSSFSK